MRLCTLRQPFHPTTELLVVRGQRRSNPRVRPCASASGSPNGTPSARESLGMLEAFFVGRALVEVLNTRLGSLVGDTLAEVGKAEAEFRRSLQEFQDEVMDRAQREMVAAGANPSQLTSGSSSSAYASVQPDVGECADNLRAEVATARALVQQIKQKPAVLK